MTMKFCPNYGCVAYGRVVYTQTTRCVFCRWDLKPPRMKSEMQADEAGPAEIPGKTTIVQAPAIDTRAHHKRPVLRHLA
ncbi:MAG: hypothetical protein WA628_18120 [Terriglobales bacterium]